LHASTQKWIDRLDIRCQTPRQRTDTLSGGNQQKVALARLLHHDVDVLLLDEPTRGVDVAAKVKIYQIINEMAAGSIKERRPPKSILMVSSYIPELIGVCDRVAVMYRGRLGELKNVQNVNEHLLMLTATGKESN
jgi:ribose transport system ATP-binding protein